MNLKRIADDVLDVYRKNWPMLILVAVMYNVLSIVSLLVLLGPLSGGMAKLVLNALERDDRTVEVGDLFDGVDSLNRFGCLFALGLITALATTVGHLLLFLPGLYLSAIWLFVFFLVIDKNSGVSGSLALSKTIVERKGLGMNLLIALIGTGLIYGALSVPYAGVLVACLLTPAVWLIEGSAYLQQVREDDGTLADLFGEGA